MARLPNADRATIDKRKLREYLLNPDHPAGKHKARVFDAAFGLTRADADLLHDMILGTLRDPHDARPGIVDEHGRRFVVDLELRNDQCRARVRTSWIVRAEDDPPRFVTAYVL